jgi:hypothetical protein
MALYRGGVYADRRLPSLEEQCIAQMKHFAGKPEAARVGREGATASVRVRPAEERTGNAEQQAAGSEPNGRLQSIRA